MYLTLTHIWILASSSKSVALQWNCLRKAFNEISELWYYVKTH